MSSCKWPRGDGQAFPSCLRSLNTLCRSDGEAARRRVENESVKSADYKMENRQGSLSCINGHQRLTPFLICLPTGSYLEERNVCEMSPDDNVTLTVG
jgi:hypothetical protein